MIVELLKDLNKRFCAVCRKRILKGKPMVKYDFVIDNFGNSRMFFAHLDCLIQKLQTIKKRIDAEVQKIPKIRFEINRYEQEKGG